MGFTKNLVNYDSKDSFAYKLREKRAHRIKSLIAACYKENKKVSIIDIGGTKTYWKIIPEQFLRENNVHITVVNLPASEPLPPNDELFTYCEGNGCNLSEFKDNTFDIAHSNSVIEHVGDWNNVASFSKEIKRVAKEYYLQTPNYWFPIEPHFVFPFFHWLPKSLRIRLLANFNIGVSKKALNHNEAKKRIDHCNLLSSTQLTGLFPGDFLYKERFFLFVKSLIIVKRNK